MEIIKGNAWGRAEAELQTITNIGKRLSSASVGHSMEVENVVA